MDFAKFQNKKRENVMSADLIVIIAQSEKVN